MIIRIFLLLMTFAIAQSGYAVDANSNPNEIVAGMTVLTPSNLIIKVSEVYDDGRFAYFADFGRGLILSELFDGLRVKDLSPTIPSLEGFKKGDYVITQEGLVGPLVEFFKDAVVLTVSPERGVPYPHIYRGKIIPQVEELRGYTTGAPVLTRYGKRAKIHRIFADGRVELEWRTTDGRLSWASLNPGQIDDLALLCSTVLKKISDWP